MVAELISVGTEILLGNIVNTNAAYLSKKCAGAGVSVYYQSTVGDNEQRLKDTIKTAISRSEIVILTGGLGPTKDDITKEVVAEVLGLPLIQSETAKNHITSYFEKINKTDIAENNWKQSMTIQGAKELDNPNGTALGLIVETEQSKVILLPGPPNEMIPMVESQVVSYLQSLTNQVIYSVMVKVAGIGESKAETMIQDMIEQQSNPTIAPYAKTGEVHFRITASANTEKEAEELVKPVVSELQKRFGNLIYTLNEEETLEEVVVKLMQKHELTLTTAESCTGGLLTGRIVNVPGVSEVLKEGFVTYTNKAKRKYLDVSKTTLKKYGAVSDQIAREMVKGAAIGADSDVAVSITGIAGPDGGTEEKPVGTVYIGCYVNEKVTVKHYNFTGSREKIRNYSVTSALDLIRHCLIENYE